LESGGVLIPPRLILWNSDHVGTAAQACPERSRRGSPAAGFIGPLPSGGHVEQSQKHGPPGPTQVEFHAYLRSEGSTTRMPFTSFITTLVTTILLLAPTPAHPQADHHHAETLGTVTFATSCNPKVQPQFNRAVALMHSFQFQNAIEAFDAILVTDPSCSIAYWGIALSHWGNPFAAGLKSAKQLEQGLKAVKQARVSPRKTERERAYVEAVAHLFSDTANTDQRSRKLAYENAMAALSTAHPEDTEATIFYALALAADADPTDKTYAKQLKSGAMLESLFAHYPNHPGLAHYIIHAYDVPSLAPRAIEAAQRYSDIAPSTPHALHMPSHTFTRVGDWQASIEANLAAAASARTAGQTPEELHSTDYLVYAYLQTAQDSAAKLLVESAAQSFARFDPASPNTGAGSPATAYFARAAIPARYCLERQAWSDAAKLEPLSSPFPYTDAITYFARGLGAARLKDRAAALSTITSLEQMRDNLTKMKEAYWANQVDIQRQEVSAWLAFAGGDSRGAVAGMRAAAEQEDKTEKSVITPGPLAPARELLAELLLDLNRPAEALKEFEATLTREPNRFRSLYGAGKAANLSEDRKTAQTYFQKLLKVAGRADEPGREELAEARRGTDPE
jgi:tetratricopeptide (TPR) repeat protein